jgi:hypothetical protein
MNDGSIDTTLYVPTTTFSLPFGFCRRGLEVSVQMTDDLFFFFFFLISKIKKKVGNPKQSRQGEFWGGEQKESE